MYSRQACRNCSEEYPRRRQQSSGYELVTDAEHRRFHQLAHDHRGARSHGGTAVRDDRRVRLRDLDEVAIDAQSFRRDLREHRVRALAHLGAGGKHAHPAFGCGLRSDHRRHIALARAGESRSVQKRRQGDAFLHLAARVFLGEAPALGVIVAELESAIEERRHVNLFPHHLPHRQRFTLADKIAAAEFFRREAERFGDLVHLPLQREDALGGAEAAEGAVRREVRGHRLAADAHVGAEVRSGGVDGPPRQHHRRERGISAAIDEELDVHGQQLAVTRDRSAMPRARRMPLSGCGHVFRAVVNDLHGLARLERQQRRMPGDHRRIFFLPSETAAGLGLNHLHLVHRQVEQGHQRSVDVERTLHRSPDRHALLRVIGGNHALRLDVELLLRAGFVLAFHDKVGAAPRALHVAALYQVSLENVVFTPDHLLLGERVIDGEHRRQGLDFEFNSTPRFFEQIRI